MGFYLTDFKFEAIGSVYYATYNKELNLLQNWTTQNVGNIENRIYFVDTILPSDSCFIVWKDSDTPAKYTITALPNKGGAFAFNSYGFATGLTIEVVCYDITGVELGVLEGLTEIGGGAFALYLYEIDSSTAFVRARVKDSENYGDVILTVPSKINIQGDTIRELILDYLKALLEASTLELEAVYRFAKGMNVSALNKYAVFAALDEDDSCNTWPIIDAKLLVSLDIWERLADGDVLDETLGVQVGRLQTILMEDKSFGGLIQSIQIKHLQFLSNEAGLGCANVLLEIGYTMNVTDPTKGGL